MNVSLMFILIRNWTIDQQLLFQITWRHMGDVFTIIPQYALLGFLLQS